MFADETVHMVMMSVGLIGIEDEMYKKPRGRPRKYFSDVDRAVAHVFLRYFRRETRKEENLSIAETVDLELETLAMEEVVKRADARDRKRLQRSNWEFRDNENEKRRLRVNAIERLKKADAKAFEKAEREGKRMASRAIKH